MVCRLFPLTGWSVVWTPSLTLVSACAQSSQVSRQLPVLAIEIEMIVEMATDVW